MSLAAIIGRKQTAASARAPVARGLEPSVLREAGILADPSNPEDACRRARFLMQQGEYGDARALVAPHAADRAYHDAVIEIAAECAVRTFAADAQKLVDRALAAYVACEDIKGQARMRSLSAELLLAAGELKSAANFIKSAENDFRRAGDAGAAAAVNCLSAEVHMRGGEIDLALAAIDDALDELRDHGTPRCIAYARLTRARVFAALGNAAPAARELLHAESVLGASGSTSDRLSIRIARAETLLLLGQTDRAALGLSRILPDVVNLEEVGTCAQVHLLLGEALTTTDPAAARRHLSRCRHIYEGMRFSYFVAQCDIGLARVEARLGLNPAVRLAKIPGEALADWPLLAAKLQVARASITAAHNPEAARRDLYDVRRFALASGNRSLARTIDALLLAAGLAAKDEIDGLTPVDAAADLPGAGASAMPIPMLVPSAEEEQAKVMESAARLRAERLVRVEAAKPALAALEPPRVPRLRLAVAS